MPKIHTRVKRRRNMPTHKNPYYLFHPVLRIRPKTFSSEERAHAFAKAKSISGYSLKRVKKGARFEIVPAEK